MNLIQSAHAAALAPVMPDTDWLGVGVVVVVVLAVSIAACWYVVHVRRKPGVQYGEEDIERIAERLHLKRTQAPLVVQTETHEFDGRTFASQAKLDEYKAAKAIVDSYKP